MPKTNYIPLACVGSIEAHVWSAEARVGSLGRCVGLPGVRVGSARVFRYQHVGIPNAKCSCSESSRTLGPNAKGLALHLQWNIGFRTPMLCAMKHT